MSWLPERLSIVSATKVFLDIPAELKLSIDNISEYFFYESDSIFRKYDTKSVGQRPRTRDAVTIRNSRRGGNRTYQEHGHAWVHFNGINYRAGLITLWLHGIVVPDEAQIVYIDKDPCNFKIDNLRIASVTEVQYVRRLNGNNKTGYKNVSWHKGSRCFITQVYYTDIEGIKRKKCKYADDLRAAVANANLLRIEIAKDFAYDGVAAHIDALPSIELAAKIKEDLLKEIAGKVVSYMKTSKETFI